MSDNIYKDPNRFYVYAYLREDGTPYYIGKGNGNRAYHKSARCAKKPTDKSRIVLLKERLSEQAAFKHEIELITFYGRKDLRTGILRNLTDGGEGTSGCIVSDITKRKHANKSQKTLEKMSEANIGTHNPMYGKSHTEKSRKMMSQNRLGNKNGSYGKRWFHDPITHISIKCFLENKPENYIFGRKMKQQLKWLPENDSNVH